MNAFLLIVLILFLGLNPTTAHSNPPSGCTVFTLVKGDQVFFGGNDDYINPDSYYWVDQGDSLNYGVIWIGTPDNVQQGVNECGLAYDANGLPRFDVNPHRERLAVPGDYTIYPIRIMNECATVEEVIEWVNTHEWHTFMHDQMQFADATGDAVIISAGKDGEVVFTRKEPGDGFIVSTNFNVANPENGFGYPCWRYTKAQEILGLLVNIDHQLTESDVVKVLDNVHVNGGSSWTIASMLADLTNGLVYIYYFHQFDKPVVINVDEELNNPGDPGAISMLFPEEVREEADRRYTKIMAKARSCNTITLIWAGLVVLSLILLFPFSGKNQKGLKLWVPAVVILGPFGFIALLTIGRSNKRTKFGAAILEAIGDIIPIIIIYIAILVAFITIPFIQGSWTVQLIVIILLPVISSWLVFMYPLLKTGIPRSYENFLIQRLPHAIVVANLGMAGITIFALPIVNWSIQSCSIFPFSGGTLLILVVIIVLCSLVGIWLVVLFEHWAIRHGYKAWSVFIWNDGEANTANWRKLWWWILISYLAFLLGIAAGAGINNILQ